jgi:hypothetical protein
MWRCPKCKARIRILQACASVVVYADGIEQESGFEWDDHSEAECTRCEWHGTAGEAYADEL